MNRFIKVKVKPSYIVVPYTIVLPDPVVNLDDSSSSEELDEYDIYEPSISVAEGKVSKFEDTFKIGRCYDVKDYLTWSSSNDLKQYAAALACYKYEQKHKIYTETNVKGVTFVPLSNYWYKKHRKKKDYVKDLTEDGIEPNPGPLNRHAKKMKGRNRNRKNVRGNVRRKMVRNQAKNNRGSRAFENDTTKQNIGSEVATARLGYMPDFIGFNGAPYGVKSFKMNDFWDIDPSLFSSILAGIKRYTDYYYQGLVLKFKMKFQVQNKRGTLIRFYVIASIDALDTIIGSHAQAKDVCENNEDSEFVKSVTVGVAPDVSEPVYFSQFLPNMTKKGAYLNSEIYNCLYNASPVYPFYINFIAYSLDSGDPLDVIVDSAFILKVLFMEWRTQDDTGPILLSQHKVPGGDREYRPYTEDQLKVYNQNKLSWKYSRKDINLKNPAMVQRVPTTSGR
jgi:hypothetical protein